MNEGDEEDDDDPPINSQENEERYVPTQVQYVAQGLRWKMEVEVEIELISPCVRRGVVWFTSTVYQRCFCCGLTSGQVGCAQREEEH